MLGFKEFKVAVMESALNENVSPKVYKLDKSNPKSVVKALISDKVFTQSKISSSLYPAKNIKSVMINSEDGDDKDPVDAIQQIKNEWNVWVGFEDGVPIASYENGTIVVTYK
jgi:hypothetical protein